MPTAVSNKTEKRDKIIKVSLQLFAKNGYDSTTIRMIAKDAGISLGLLYNYFNGKNEVLKVIYEKSVVDVMRSFMVSEDIPTAELKFEHLLNQIFKSANKNLLFYKLFYSIRMQPSVQKLLSQQFSSLNSYIQANLESILIELGYKDFETESLILYALIDGASNHYVLNHKNYPIEDIKKAIVERYCQKQMA
ncbi:MAG: AcrR family transcriptional regulator [Limisphaerales bacterium]|jgi:AcrR family transcriptional regulator